MPAFEIVTVHIMFRAHPKSELSKFINAYKSSEIMSELIGMESNEVFCGLDEPPMYVLSNKIGMYGAAGMLPGLGIEDLAYELGADLIVLPSSVHEVILVPAEDETDLVHFAKMVRVINANEVDAKDRLSDSIYYYDRQHGMVILEFDEELPKS